MPLQEKEEAKNHPHDCEGCPSLLHQVIGDRIFDSGKEVVWRSLGCSYAHQTQIDYLTAWNRYIPYMKAMGLNVVRLAFEFSWDPDVAAGVNLDILDFTRMDAIIAFLEQNGFKSILDNHASYDSIMDYRFVPSWQEVADHYKSGQPLADSVVAFELMNEPSMTGTPGRSALANAQQYHDATVAINAIDPNRICIWQNPDRITSPGGGSAYYIPDFSKILSLMLPNVVYTKHDWWTQRVDEINTYGAVEVSRHDLDPIIYWRAKYGIPMWLGETGGPYDYTGFTPTNPKWAACQQIVFRCEEQAIGWSLWLGDVAYPDIQALKNVAKMFPLSYFNPDLIRQPWILPALPDLRPFVSPSSNMDFIKQFELAAWHNNDFVTLDPQLPLPPWNRSIAVKVRRSHYVGVPDAQGNCPVGAWKSSDGKSCYQDVVETVNVTQPTTITNHENTPDYPGDWNLYVDALISRLATFKGIVSDQIQSGEVVSIDVVKPDGTTETLTTPTLADKSWKTSKQYTIPGSYQAVAHIAEDIQYLAADTIIIVFVLP